jgi:thioesterase domain-containing protein
MSTRPRHLIRSLLLALPLCCLSVHAQQADDLQQRMSSAEFKAAGLDKLSPQELQNLDNWLNGHAVVTTKVVNSSGKPVFYSGDQKRHTIDTHIVGHFDGWNKNLELTMANGQQWQVIDPEPHSCRPSENTEVKIKPSLMGSWLMYVPSCYENAHVKRLR